MAELILGVDGGGSKTMMCLAARDGTIVRQRRVGGTNPLDNRRWREELTEVFAGSDAWRADLVAAHVAIGGYTENPAADRQVDAALNELLGALPLQVVNDVFLAHDAAFLGAPGVLLIAGTGSMAVMRAADGTLRRNGGWGHVWGDEGSGHWIGREALSLATKSLDGRAPAPALAAAVVAELGITDPNPTVGLLTWMSELRHPRSQVAALCRVVVGLAEAGDAPARAIVEAAVAELALHVAAGRVSAGLGEQGPWALLGGLSNSPLVLGGLERRLGPATRPALPPCGGALWNAARRAGWTVDEAWLERVRQGLG